jgi:hypothetical protein
MPLSTPADREELHERKVHCRGYKRADGLWDIEGHLTDVKTYAFDNRWRGRVVPGDPIHEMWLRLTVDDEMTIHGVEAVTDKSPFEICPSITPNFQRLIGLRMGPGWRREIKQRIGGVEGCTHLVELLGPLATTAFQTMSAERVRKRKAQSAEAVAAGGAAAAAPPRRRPPILDTCHAWRSDGPVVQVELPGFYTGAAERAS